MHRKDNKMGQNVNSQLTRIGLWVIDLDCIVFPKSPCMGTNAFVIRETTLEEGNATPRGSRPTGLWDPSWNYLVSLLRKRVRHFNDDTSTGLFVLHHVDADHPLE